MDLSDPVPNRKCGSVLDLRLNLYAFTENFLSVLRKIILNPGENIIFIASNWIIGEGAATVSI